MRFTVGDLVMFLSYLAALLGPIATLASSATALQNSLSGLDRVLDLLAEPLEMPSKPGAIVVERETDARANHAARRSSPTPARPTPVLHDINLDVRPGEMIALVGPSGAGKTTLCNLIARFYDPTAGAVMLDGGDLRDITADSYRRLLGHRRAGHVSVRRHDCREHRLRPARRDAPRKSSGPPSRPMRTNSSSSCPTVTTA